MDKQYKHLSGHLSVLRDLMLDDSASCIFYFERTFLHVQMQKTDVLNPLWRWDFVQRDLQ